MITTSACLVRMRSRSRPAASRRLRVTHFLLRATLFHISPIPSRCAPHCRSGSPPSGCSTLITSAPCSPIQVAISGPAARVAASITRRPARAPSVTGNSLVGVSRWSRQEGAGHGRVSRGRAGRARDAQFGGHEVRAGRGWPGADLPGVECAQQQPGGDAGQPGVLDLDHRQRRVGEDEPRGIAVDHQGQVVGETAAAATDRVGGADRQRAAADHQRGERDAAGEQFAGRRPAVLLRRLDQPHGDPAGIEAGPARRRAGCRAAGWPRWTVPWGCPGTRSRCDRARPGARCCRRAPARRRSARWARRSRTPGAVPPPGARRAGAWSRRAGACSAR